MAPKEKAKKAPASAKKATAAKAAPATKKAPAAKKEAAAPARKATAIATRYTKTQIVTDLMETTGLSKKQVQAVLDDLSVLIERHIKKGGCGDFVLPGLLKIATIKKPATKARKGINPFTKEEVMFKAKPASIAVKVRPLSKLKEMAS
jgi:nucleoid DNA-binding protein